jgi:hypothetical protein
MCGDFRGGWGSVSLFVDYSHVSLFVALIGMAAISGFVLTKCIEEEDADLAWVWGAVFVATTFGIAWIFWRFV